jgi:acetyl esterase
MTPGPSPVGYSVPNVRTTEEHLSGPLGPVRVRIYHPEASGPRPAFVWAHGGGWLGGDIDMNEGDLVCRELCSRANVVVVSVDYHLADRMSVTYPSLHRELLAAHLWTLANSERLRISPGNVALGGASAGGQLAMAATLELAERNAPLPSRLLLIYPVLHVQLPDSPEVLSKTRSLPREKRFFQSTLDMIWDNYLGDQTETRYASVERHDLTPLPPCLLVVNEYDDLRASGEAFVIQAAAQGVQIDVHFAVGMLHGHVNLTPLVAEVDNTLEVMARYLDRPTAH